MHLWCPQAIASIAPLDLFSSFLLVLYDLQFELFLLKECLHIKCALSTFFAGLRRLQFTKERCRRPLLSRVNNVNDA